METFFFYIPLRLIWTNFPKFMGEQDNPGDSIAFTMPMVTAGTPSLGSIADYFGLPTVGQLGAGTISVSALPFRAYYLVYDQWFRDENLINSVGISKGDGPDSASYLTNVPRKRGKRHDYFTSCLPFLQKGAAVQLPLGTSAAVYGANPATDINFGFPGAPGFLKAKATSDPTDVEFDATSGTPGAGASLRFVADQAIGAYADLSTAVGPTINELRQAVAVQQFLERDARGGTRYTELVFSHYRVKSPDARLQRTEYLGGGSSPINVTPLAQQTQSGLTGGSTPLANLAGIGAGVAVNHGFTKSFTEHGLVIGLVNFRADLTYFQGIERMWTRSTRYDLFWPVLEELGEQAVYNRELYAKGDANDGLVYGGGR